MNICLYLGAPNTGKSFLANKRVQEEQAASGLPVLLLDGAGTSEFVGARLCASWQDAARCVWGEPRTHARIVPAGEEDVEALAAAARAAGDVILYLDEVGLFFTAHRAPEEFARLIRVYRHARVSIHLTTQYVGDLSPMILSCANRAFIFCNDRARAVERISEEFGVDPEALPLLKQGEFIEWGRQL